MSRKTQKRFALVLVFCGVVSLGLMSLGLMSTGQALEQAVGQTVVEPEPLLLIVEPTVEPDPLLLRINTMISEYEQQVASRDTLDAMDFLDSLQGRTFLEMNGYQFTWNPQEQAIELFKANGDPEDSTTGIDGEGRQVFTVPAGENAAMEGWVDVDVVHRRIVVVLGLEKAVIEIKPPSGNRDLDGGDPGFDVFRLRCACLVGNVSLGSCSISGCSRRRFCRPRTAAGFTDGICAYVFAQG